MKDYKQGREVGYALGLEAAIEAIKEADPLEASCEWGEADEIAWAVQRHMVKAIENLKPPKKRAKEPTIEDLAMLVKRLSVQVLRVMPRNPVAVNAVNYLRRHGLQGSPLREESGND